MRFLKRDIPARGALAVLAVVAIASFVGGREQPAGATALRQAPQVAPAPPQPTAPRLAGEESLTDVDLAKLKRERWSEGVANLLAPRPVPAPAPAAPQSSAEPQAGVAPPAPPPAAPPLPFVYLGKIIDGGKATVFVGRGADHYSVEPGGEIDQYRVEQITETHITFLFRPLGTRQVLDVPQPGEEPANPAGVRGQGSGVAAAQSPQGPAVR